MAINNDLIEPYLARLRELAEREDHVGRFYLFQEQELADLEYEISNSDQAGEFYDGLIEQFRKWKAEMGEEKWREVVAYNESVNSANQNGLIDEL